MGKLLDEQRIKLTADLRTVILETELSGKSDYIYKFSYAGAVSGYSFGLCQFDVKANQGAANFLESIGFTSDEISQLKSAGGLKPADIANLNAKLAEHKTEIDTFTDEQLQLTINHIGKVYDLLRASNPEAANAVLNDEHLQLALMDYHNQFGLGLSGKPDTMLQYLKGEEVSLPGGKIRIEGGLDITDVQRYIDNTKYGQENPASVQRREGSLAAAFEKIGMHAEDAKSLANTDYITSFGISTAFLEGDVSSAFNTKGVLSVIGANGVVSAWQEYSATNCISKLTYSLEDASLQWKTSLVVAGTTIPKLYVEGVGATAYSRASYIDIAGSCSVSIHGDKNSINVGVGAELDLDGVESEIRAEPDSLILLEDNASADLHGAGFHLQLLSNVAATVQLEDQFGVAYVSVGGNHSTVSTGGAGPINVMLVGADAVAYNYSPYSTTMAFGENSQIYNYSENQLAYLFGLNGYAFGASETSTTAIYNPTSHADGPQQVVQVGSSNMEEFANNMQLIVGKTSNPSMYAWY